MVYFVEFQTNASGIVILKFPKFQVKIMNKAKMAVLFLKQAEISGGQINEKC